MPANAIVLRPSHTPTTVSIVECVQTSPTSLVVSPDPLLWKPGKKGPVSPVYLWSSQQG